MRLSNRDIVLVIGIVVAVVVTLTTVVYTGRTQHAKKDISIPKKTSMNTALKLIEFIGKHNNVTHSR